MKILQDGFTLIELMITVAIIGMLAVIAGPAYLDYTVRSQVAEGLGLSGGAKVAVTDFYQNYGAFPADNDEAGISAADEIKGEYVRSVAVAENVISIVYSDDANSRIAGEEIRLIANTTSAGSIAWFCKSAGVIPDKYVPTACE